MKLNVFKILKKTRVEGPGVRYCIWVQGCSMHCKGCQAKHTWSHTDGQKLEIVDIISDIKKQKDIEGVTFLGGEPFEQAEALGEIAEEIKKIGLSVLCFTGRYIEDLRQNSINHKLLNNIDLLIDGPFEEDKLDYSRAWCGSSNQRFHFLTDRYNEEVLKKYKNKVEVNILKNGFIFINGMGDFKKIIKKLSLKTN